MSLPLTGAVIFIWHAHMPIGVTDTIYIFIAYILTLNKCLTKVMLYSGVLYAVGSTGLSLHHIVTFQLQIQTSNFRMSSGNGLG